MLDRDILVAHMLCGIFGFVQCLVGIGGDIDFIGAPAASRYLRESRDTFLRPVTHCGRVNAHFHQQLGYKPVFVREKSLQQMKLVYLLIQIGDCNTLRLLYHLK
jgi:hypothetical protein